jgi:hypothetical protein
MRFASIERDYWELESGEERHREHSDKFWVPALEDRKSLQNGQLAKLLFLIEAQDEAGRVESGVERMWVLVTHVEPEYYVGRLVNQPATLEEADDVYLSVGAEVPFRAEHVIDTHQWAAQDVQDFLASAPFKAWHGA